MAEQQGQRLVSHAEVEQFLRKFGCSPEHVRDILRDLPDPVEFDQARQVFAKDGITIGALMDRMGASP